MPRKAPDNQIDMFGGVPAATEPVKAPPRSRAKTREGPPPGVTLPPGVEYVSQAEVDAREAKAASERNAQLLAMAEEDDPAMAAALANDQPAADTYAIMGCPTEGCRRELAHTPGAACMVAVPSVVTDVVNGLEDLQARDIPLPPAAQELAQLLAGPAEVTVVTPDDVPPHGFQLLMGEECAVCDYPPGHPVHHGGTLVVPAASPEGQAVLAELTEAAASLGMPAEAIQQVTATVASVGLWEAPEAAPSAPPASPAPTPAPVAPVPAQATPGGTNIHIGVAVPAMLPGMEGMVALPGLRHKFLVPPFTVLDTKAGYWQEAKADWLALGIQSEVGRSKEVLMGGKAQANLNSISDQNLHSHKEKERLKDNEWAQRQYAKGNERVNPNEGSKLQGVSIFDPVLCELANLWYCPPGGRVLDPFAGGSVRGVVTAVLGREYHGQELRPEQVAANVEQWELIKTIHPKAPPPAWYVGDSTQAVPVAPKSVDMVFSCPPYGDLEVYSDLPGDISNMPYDQFIAAYWLAIRKATAALKPNRFIVWVVGDFRDKDNNLRCFVRDTIDAFLWSDDDGVPIHLYNEARLLTAIGTAPTRASAQFSAGRKLIKTEQTVLVFVKGDGMQAAKACGAVEVNWGATE